MYGIKSHYGMIDDDPHKTNIGHIGNYNVNGTSLEMIEVPSLKCCYKFTSYFSSECPVRKISFQNHTGISKLCNNNAKLI